MKTICDSCKNKSICKDVKNVTCGHASCTGWTPYGSTNANDIGS